MSNEEIIELFEKADGRMSVSAMLNIARASEVVKLEERVTHAIIEVMPIVKHMPWVVGEIQRKRDLIRAEFEKLVAPYRVTEGTEGTKGTKWPVYPPTYDWFDSCKNREDV